MKEATLDGPTHPRVHRSEEAAPGGWITERYRVQRALGVGGMAEVFAVIDEASGETLALKRLKKEHAGAADSVSLFQREFYTLAHLSHPNVPEVYEYGIASGRPFYTMEYLDGEDLRTLAPVPFEQAARWMRSVASALSLVHSRRLVHRDVSPRNIRCTATGDAKLMDFGAMVPMGPNSRLLGTPPCCAPEVLNLQSLEASADLFSLGATFYFATTGRYPYPARDFRSLRDAWRSRPRPPSRRASGIPPEFDALLLELLFIAPSARPSSAAEVLSRLDALIGESPSEVRVASQAHLSAPGLVGRARELASIRQLVLRARARNGTCLVISGDAGVGRSRLLDASVLEAQLAGFHVVRADRSDAVAGDFGVATALGRRLFATDPLAAERTGAPWADILAHIVPELEVVAPLRSFESPLHRRSLLVSGFRDWFSAFAQHRPLLIAVDDVDHADEPSLAALALLAESAADTPVAIALTALHQRWDPESRAAALLGDLSTAIELSPLKDSDTRKLVGSVFGEVPNVDFVARTLGAVAKGNPAALMASAQHLIETGEITYEAGTWYLPRSLSSGALPTSMAHTLELRVAGLSAGDRGLARALALRPELRFTFEECVALTGSAEPRRVASSLDQLVAAGLLIPVGGGHALAQRAWVEPLLKGLDGDLLRDLHRRLALVLIRRGDQEFRAAQHWIEAGDVEAALELILVSARDSRDATLRDQRTLGEVTAGLPDGWVRTFRLALEQCERLGRPAVDVFTLRWTLSALGQLSPEDVSAVLVEHLQECAVMVGLDLLAEVQPDAPPGVRLGALLQKASERFDSLPDSARVLSPPEAIRALAEAVTFALSLFASSHDFGFYDRVPSLAALTPLSPSLHIVERLREAVACRVGSQYERARSCYIELLARLEEPDGAGLEATHRRHVSYSIASATAALEAAMGLASALERIQRPEADPMYEANGKSVRMIFHLWSGDLRAAEAFRREMELIEVEREVPQLHRVAHRVVQLAAYALCDDLQHVKNMIEEFGPIARRFPAWEASLGYARGEAHRIRGEGELALEELGRALSVAPAGRSHSWPFVAGAFVRTLIQTGRIEAARTEGTRLLVEGEAAGLGYLTNYTRVQLALAEAYAGAFDRAVALADQALSILEERGIEGLNLSLALEARTRVSIVMGDAGTFEHWIERCRVSFDRDCNPLLSARFERLLLEASEKGLECERVGTKRLRSGREVVKALRSMRPEARTSVMLDVLVDRSGGSSGLFYRVVGDRVVRVAEMGDVVHARDADEQARVFIHAEIEAEQDVTCTGTLTGGSLNSLSEYYESAAGLACHAVLLSHETPKRMVITGLAIIFTKDTEDFTLPLEIARDFSEFLASEATLVSVAPPV